MFSTAFADDGRESGWLIVLMFFYFLVWFLVLALLLLEGGLYIFV